MRPSATFPLLRPAIRGAARPGVALAVAGLALGACAPAAGPAVSPAPLAAWPGVYAIEGRGFPDGTRAAQLEIARLDSTYRLAVHGPPGELVAFRIAADSAHVVWDLGAGDEEMTVALRLAGDSLAGRWRIGAVQGPIVGRRVR